MHTSLPTIGHEIAIASLDTVHQRLGDLRFHTLNDDKNIIHAKEITAWVRGNWNKFSFNEAEKTTISGDYDGVDVGLDAQYDLSENWYIYLGLMGGYKHGEFETSGYYNNYAINPSDIYLDTYIGALYATLYNQNGYYSDIVLEYADFHITKNAADTGSAEVSGNSLAASIELGKTMPFKSHETWAIEPQLQLKLIYVTWNDFHDGYNDVQFDDNLFVNGRAGLRLRKDIIVDDIKFEPWVYGGVLYDFMETKDVEYANYTFHSPSYDLIYEGKAGLLVGINDHWQINGSVSMSTDFNNFESYEGKLGLRLHW